MTYASVDQPIQSRKEARGIPAKNAWSGFDGGLTFIVLAALLIRLLLVPYGLPLLLYEDEPIYYDFALGFGLGHWDIGYFKKPGFFLYFYSAFYALAYLYTPWMNWVDYVSAFWRDPSLIAVVGRTVSAFFAAGTVGLTGLWGKRFISAPVGLMAALWLAGNLTHLRISSVVISDIPALFFITAAAGFALKIAEAGRWRDYLLCAAAIALAMSFKYNFFSMVFLLAGHSVFHMGEISSESASARILPTLQVKHLAPILPKILRDRRLWLSMGLAAGLFLLLNPMILQDFQTFQAHLNLEKKHMLLRDVRNTHASWQPMASAAEIFLKLLPRLLGWPLYLLGLAGMAVGFRCMRRVSLVLLSFPAVFLLAVSQFKLINTKYLLPVAPFWLIFAALFLWECARWLETRRVESKKAAILVVLLTFGLAVPVWWESLAYLSVYRQEDTRNLADEAVRNKAREGDRFFLEPDTLTLDLHLFRSRLVVTDFHHGNFRWLPDTGSVTGEGMAAALQARHPRYVLMNLGEAKKSRDAGGRAFYRMPYAPAYYRELQRDYTFDALFSPCRVRLSRDVLAETLRAQGVGALYGAIQRHKSRRNRPGPFLLLVKRR